MAKYESSFIGNFQEFLGILDNGIKGRSISATLEDSSYFRSGGIQCAVRVYERYSYMGGNRVSLNVTLLGDGGQLFLSAITSGGSKAVFFKINTLGEEAFLQHIVDITEKYRRK
ncbi:MAG: DUF6054 family protein [Oscillospiraceae bacterium]|nr:DUF6054 family protein [Oscillospiraceae bacterium]